MHAITSRPPEPQLAAQSQVAASQSPSKFRRLLLSGAGAVALIGVAITGSWWLTEGRYIGSTDKAFVRGHIAVLGPRIEGNVEAIKVVDNQRVHKGDPLIELEP